MSPGDSIALLKTAVDVHTLGLSNAAGLLGKCGFRILTPSPIAMKEGALIDYVVRLGPLPTRWRTLITGYEPPARFVDEQLAGPYSFWHHTHTFVERDGGTLIGDHVRYALPFGPLGEAAHALAIRRQLRAIFAHRRRVLAELYPGGAT